MASCACFFVPTKRDPPPPGPPCPPGWVDRGRRGAPRLLANGVLRLFLRADEEDLAPRGHRLPDEAIGLLDQRHRLLQVDDVDAVPFGEDEAGHLGIPAARLMAEVHARFQQLLHRDNRHSKPPSPVTPPPPSSRRGFRRRAPTAGRSGRACGFGSPGRKKRGRPAPSPRQTQGWTYKVLLSITHAFAGLQPPPNHAYRIVLGELREEPWRWKSSWRGRAGRRAGPGRSRTPC